MSKGKVGIIGSGTIGRGWIILFARAGYDVSVYDQVDGAVDSALVAVRHSLLDMRQLGLVDDVEVTFGRIAVASTLEEAVGDALYVQESVFEDADVKEAVFQEMDKHAPAEAILGSSCSAIPPEEFLTNIPGRARCIIVHPFSPPHAVPLTEVVTSPWNSQELVQRVCELLEEIGQTPAVINKPVVGFAVNRLQAAVVNEAMHLVKEGVVSPRDLDRCMRMGLGLRWAFLGPFETMELNAPGGFMDYASKFGHAYQSMGAELRVDDDWDPKAVESIEAWRRSELSVDDIADRRAWRDRLLLELRQLVNNRRDAWKETKL